MSNNPAPMITKPAALKRPAASKTAAPMLITRPRKVRTLGWILERASPRTIRRITLLHAMPIARVNVIFTALPILPENGSARNIVDREQLHDFHFPDASRDLNFHGVAYLFPEQRTSNRGGGRDASFGHVGLFAGNQVV